MKEINRDYSMLQDILDDAYNQAAQGKGQERHADKGVKIENQTTLQIARLVQGAPHAGPLFQVIKKAIESTRLTPLAAIHEILGAIVYAAFCIIILREKVE